MQMKITFFFLFSPDEYRCSDFLNPESIVCTAGGLCGAAIRGRCCFRGAEAAL